MSWLSKGIRSVGKAVKTVAKPLGKVASIAGDAVSFIPGVGSAVAPILKAGGALAQGKGFGAALREGALGALPMGMGKLAAAGGVLGKVAGGAIKLNKATGGILGNVAQGAVARATGGFAGGQPGALAPQGAGPGDPNGNLIQRTLAKVNAARGGAPGAVGAVPPGFSLPTSQWAPAPVVQPNASVAAAGAPGQAPTEGDALRGQIIRPEASADATRARGYVGTNLDALQQLPDRQALAQQSLALLNKSNDEAFTRESTQVGRRAAALGRVGASGVGTEFGNLEARMGELRNRQASDLAIQTAQQQQADQLARLNATQGVFGQLTGEDRTDRGELRGERQHQDQLEQDAYGRRLDQYGLEEGAIDRDITRALRIGGYGEQGDPSLYEAELAQQDGAQAGGMMGDAAALIQQIMARRGAQSPAPTGTAPAPAKRPLPRGRMVNPRIYDGAVA